ncbi:MAG: hypothetical protein HY812_01925 [Planctomycetes bacterium]|nr:hypothetical protein [Planctomycetota bacterium]
MPPEELERYRGLEIVITTVLKAPGAADAEVTRFADRFDPASGWICAVPGQPILWLVGPAEVVRSTVEEIAGPRATGVAGAGDEPERQAANSGRLCVQFDEVEGSPLADFAALATEVLHQPVHVDSGLEDMRLRFLGAFELELGDFRGFLEAVLAVHNVIVIESEDGLTLRRSLPVARDEGTALVVPVERADLAAEQDRWHPIRVSLVLQKADAADVAEMMRSPFMELFVERLQANAASNSVELTGSGFSVWRTVRVLEEIDRLCAEPAGR